MPGRDITFVNDGIYHIFNRTADKSGVFSDNNLSLLFLDLLKYYRSERANLRYSNYQELNLEIKKFYEEHNFKIIEQRSIYSGKQELFVVKLKR